MTIAVKRVYEPAAPEDGLRVLVDRLWPRGLSKEAAAVALWEKDAAPSDELRKWFHADPSQWAEFRRRYLAELREQRDRLRELAERAAGETVTLLFASKDAEHNNAVVLAEYLRRLA